MPDFNYVPSICAEIRAHNDTRPRCARCHCDLLSHMDSRIGADAMDPDLVKWFVRFGYHPDDLLCYWCFHEMFCEPDEWGSITQGHA